MTKEAKAAKIRAAADEAISKAHRAIELAAEADNGKRIFVEWEKQQKADEITAEAERQIAGLENK